MSYILISNVGTLLCKYKPIVSSEFIKTFEDLGLSRDVLGKLDMGLWFEWSFNHILRNYFYLELAERKTETSFSDIFHAIEPNYTKAFIQCLDVNAKILKSIPSNLKVRAVLSHENVIITTTAKIDIQEQ